MKLQINPPSATVSTPESPINQMIKIANPSKVIKREFCSIIYFLKNKIVF